MSVSSSTAAFCTDGAETILRHTSLTTNTTPVYNIEKIKYIYEIERCISFINDKSVPKLVVALQFPDEDLVNSARVATLLRDATSCEIFILGDTSYGSCCVDEVAAQHGNADAIIHFGASCLSSTNRVAVEYVFTKRDIDVEDCALRLAECVEQTYREQPILLFYDLAYHHCIDEISSKLRATFGQLRTPKILTRGPAPSPSLASSDLMIFGRVFDRVDDVGALFYIGDHPATSALLTNLVMSMCGGGNTPCYSYDAVERNARLESAHVNRTIMKRYYLVEKIKDSAIIGILINTLVVKDYLKMIDRAKELIRKAGKKFYLISVGKINPAKLANFADIDLFVTIACVESCVVDCTDYYRPVATPYELEVALNPSRSWQTDFSIDFADLLPGGKRHVDIEENNGDERLDVSLITGNIRRLGGLSAESNGGGGVNQSDSSLVVRDRYDVAVNAAEFLTSRTFRGLEPKYGETKVEKAVQGRMGIAMAYEEEPKQ